MLNSNSKKWGENVVIFDTFLSGEGTAIFGKFRYATRLAYARRSASLEIKKIVNKNCRGFAEKMT